MTVVGVSRSRLLLGGGCLGLFAASSATVFPFVTFSYLGPFDTFHSQSVLIWIMFSLLLAVALSAIVAMTRDGGSRRILLIAPTLLLFLGICRVWGVLNFENLPQYGDTGQFESKGLVDGNARWLLGIALIREVFFAVSLVVPNVGAETFVRVLGSAVMAAWGTWFLAKRSDSVIPWLIITSPMWILFSVGYDEYYPFVAGIVTVAIWQIVSDAMPIHRQTAYVVVGLLPILYIGALPIAVCLLIRQWGQEVSWGLRVRGILIALAAMVLSIEIGGDFGSYAMQLNSNLTRGGAMVTDLSVEAPEGSIFGPISYTLSSTHAVNIWFWLAVGMGGAALAIPSVYLAFLRLRAIGALRGSLVQRFQTNDPAKILLTIFATGYIVFMLPVLGPTQDIDLYFWSLFSFLLLAGVQLDRVVRNSNNIAATRVAVMQLISFGFAPATSALVVFGVSR